MNRLKIVIPVLLVAAGAYFFTRPDGSTDTRLFASGTIEATTADLGFQMPGRIQSIEVGEGDLVSGGQFLAELDAREVQAALDVARAQVAAARSRLTEMERGARPQEVASAESAARSAALSADNARREVERARTLFDGGAISRQQLDQAETGLAVASGLAEQAEQRLALVREGPRAESIGAQRAMVQQAEAGVARAEALAENARLSAPFPGQVTVKHRQSGEIVGAGVPVLTLLDPDDRWVRIYVREDEIGRVHIGQEAAIASDTYPDRSYGGEVVFIGSEAEFTPRNVQTAEQRIKLVYPVKVRISGDPAFELKPGVPADVTLIGDDS